MAPTTLTDHARTATYEGDFDAARYVLRWYADRKRWTDETFRARWDGASALLGWWHGLEEAARPPLDHLTQEDAGAFLAFLAQQGLARTTIRGYRSGASALTQALRGARTLPAVFNPDYDPFRSVCPAPTLKPTPYVSPKLLAALEPRPRARLELLLALLALGMSVPEVCACRWDDVNLAGRFLLGYGKRYVTLSARAVMAFEGLESVQPRRKGYVQRVLAWNADTARRWVKRVVGSPP